MSFRAVLQLRRPRGTDFGSPPLPAAGPHTAALTDANLEDPSHPGVRRAMAGLYRMFGRPPLQATPLTSDVAAAIRATATRPRPFQTGRMESESTAERRGLVDIALVAVMRDGLLRRSEAADLLWDDVERAPDGSERLIVRRSKTDQAAEGRMALPEPADDGGPGRDKAVGTGARPRQRIRSVGIAGRTPDSAQLRGRGVSGRLQRPQPTAGHGPGPGRKRRGTSGPHGGRPLGVPCDASPIHPLPGRRAGGRRHLLRQALTTTDQAVARRRGRTVPGPACIEPAPPPLRGKRTVREPERDGTCPAPRGKPDASSDGTGTVVKYCTTNPLANNTTITPRL